MRLLRPVAAWGSLGSFRFVWFFRVHHGDRWVISGSSASSGCALGVTWFFHTRLLRSDAPLWVAGFVRVRLLRPVVPWVSLDSLEFVRFVRVHPRGLSVLSGLFGSVPGVAGYV